MSQFAYNYFNDPRNWEPGTGNLRGTAFKAGMDAMGAAFQKWRGSGTRSRGRYQLSGCKRTRAYKKSSVKQKTITAPQSRVIDTKYIDSLSAITGLKSTVPVVVGLSAIPGGSGESQRVGNDIRILKYIISIEFIHGSSVNDQTFRILLVRVKAHNTNADPGIANILINDQAGNKTPVSLRDVNSLEDFEILLDKMVLLPSNHSTSHGQRVCQYEVKTCFPQRYSGTGSTTVIRNPVFLYLLTNCANTTTGASGQVNVRTIYADI